MLPMLKRNEHMYAATTDAWRDITSGALLAAINRAIDDISQATVGRMGWRAEWIAEQMIQAQDEQTQQALAASLQSAYGIDISPILAAQGIEPTLTLARTQNVNLIRSIPTQYLSELNQTVLLGVQQGQRYEALAGSIEERYGVTQNRAKLIARDQTAKTNAAITQVRQQDLGITHYRWSTSLDERVRQSHADNEGQVFAWDDPPAETGHPGHDVNCRCVAIPLLGYAGEEEAA
ncbi:phage minor head protein [Paraburkholderia sp. BR10923]|uniref:phage head morphogenesis protein n=1 Tax=Paraburkholderia sp. BR10923 TaxID=3236992 RepID=UPI0034CE1073